MRFLQSRTEFCSAYDKNYFIIGLQLSATHILFSEGEWERLITYFIKYRLGRSNVI